MVVRSVGYEQQRARGRVAYVLNLGQRLRSKMCTLGKKHLGQYALLQSEYRVVSNIACSDIRQELSGASPTRMVSVYAKAYNI